MSETAWDPGGASLRGFRSASHPSLQYALDCAISPLRRIVLFNPLPVLLLLHSALVALRLFAGAPFENLA
jgi:hypothetical protein